jgi:predicted enzyme related to lactoylglutathione lyase
MVERTGPAARRSPWAVGVQGECMHQPGSRLTYVAPVLQVADWDRSLAFYRDQLGLNLEFAYEGFYASVVRDGCRVHLNRSAPLERDQRAFEAAEHLDACFGVEDAEALANAFASSGAVFSVELRSLPYGKSSMSEIPMATSSASFSRTTRPENEGA